MCIQCNIVQSGVKNLLLKKYTFAKVTSVLVVLALVVPLRKKREGKKSYRFSVGLKNCVSCK